MADLFDVSKIEYEGKDSKNPLAFKFYNPKEKIGGKTMEEHLRFSLAYWHTMNGGGADPFGPSTAVRPWDDETDDMKVAEIKMRGIFEIAQKLQIPYFCFHDRDIAPEGTTLRESNKNLDHIVSLAKQLIDETGVKLLWGTANAFSNPRYAQGASTSPNADVFAYAAAQVKKAMEVTKELGGDNYVFWGGREGYETLLNTNMKLELDNLARFLHMAVDYAKEIGFTGQFLIEPKPKEPTKHQYDFDSGTVIGFLKNYGLDAHFKLNIETNHATLAGHNVEHDLHLARINGMLGSIDANQGDLLLGWDTDQFPTDLYVCTYTMLEVLRNGGLGKGGLNFDAHIRRSSHTSEDIFLAHVAGMDGFARGLKVANAIIEDGRIDGFVKNRYKSYNDGIGKSIVDGKADFKSLEEYVIDKEKISLDSGKQELLESIVNQLI